MATRTVGTGKTYATTALGMAAMGSGDTMEIYDTVADGVPSLYYAQVITATNVNMTVTCIDDVFFYTGTSASILITTSAGNYTQVFNYIKGVATQAQGVTFGGAAVGNLTFNGCNIKSLNTQCVNQAAGNNAVITANGCVFASDNNAATAEGWRMTLAGTGITQKINNCVLIGIGGSGYNCATTTAGAGSTCVLTNCYIYSYGIADAKNSGAATLTNCYSSDGSAGTSTCTIPNAKFKDLQGTHSRFGLPDPALLFGSALIGAGADPGVTISDLYGTSKATGSGTFDVGACFYSVTAAPTQPTGCECVNWTGNVWNVHWDALVDKEHPIIKATVGGTAYYAYPAARTAPGNQRCQIGWTTDVTMARYLNLPTLGLTFSLAGVTAIAVASANVCEVASTYTTATVRTLASTGAVPVFAGITAFAQRSTGLQATWSSAITGTPTGFDIHIKPAAQIAGAELTSEAYLVARVPYTGLRNQSYMADISGNFFNAGVKYWAAVRARNAMGPDTNTTQLSAYGGGGNVTLQTTVNNYTFKAPLLALNPL